MILAHFTLKSQDVEARTFATQNTHVASCSPNDPQPASKGKPVRVILLIRPDKPQFPPVAPLHDSG